MPQGGYGAKDIGIGKPSLTQEYRKKIKRLLCKEQRFHLKRSKTIEKNYHKDKNISWVEIEQLLIRKLDDGKITKKNQVVGKFKR